MTTIKTNSTKQIYRNRAISKGTLYSPKQSSRGFVLFTTLIIMIIIGILASSSLKSTEAVETLSGNSIQRSRALQAAEGALINAESQIPTLVKNRTFSSKNPNNGVFSRGSTEEDWWRDENFDGKLSTPVGMFAGVAKPPEYVFEEIGNYVADGGSGIVSLDRGAGMYGRKTGGGREVVVYKVQSMGNGSSDTVKAVVESLYGQTN